MKTFFQALADFVGRIIASYRAYLGREKEKEYTDRRRFTLNAAVQQYYISISELLFNALQVSANATYIASPRKKEDLFSTPPAAINERGFVYFIYHGFYNGRTEVTVKAIMRILQGELNVQTGIYGFPRLKLFVQLGEDRKIIFRIAFREDVANAVRRNSNAGRT